MMKNVILKAVYSRLARQGYFGSKINGRRLSQHQARTYQLLNDQNYDVIFNSALTGDGKSLAAYLPALLDDRQTMGLYPTNELGRDQERQVNSYLKDLSLPARTQRVCRLNADELTERASAHYVTRQTELLRRIDGCEILLTNPDIYHLIMNGFYLRHNDVFHKVLNPLVMNFGLTIFDEFHIFSAPQIVSVVNSMLLVRRTHGTVNHRFLFLSATPSDQLLQNLGRAGLCYAIVKGEYCHALAGESGKVDLGEYRQITQEILLAIESIQRPEKTAETWLLENAETVIVEFFRHHPGSRGAVILNSVGAVKRCIAKLKPLLKSHGLSVGENTGFSTEDEKRDSLTKDLLIGTSTIDVGVDFQINLLIFEATDAGNFIQRLGRLGRHKGYENQRGDWVEFDTFQAYALIPKFIHERLFEQAGEAGAVRLREQECYDRETFFDLVRDVYPPVNEFKLYAQRWGGLQSAYVYLGLAQKEIKQSYETIRENLAADYKSAFSINLNQQIGKLKAYVTGDLKDERPILEVARSFRGGTGLECAVIDQTVEDERQRFKIYDLPGLLTNCHFTDVLKKAKFHALAEKQCVALEKFRFCEFYVIVGKYRDVPLRWRFHLPCDLSSQGIDRVRAGTGISVNLFEPEFENSINQHLKTLKLVYYIVRRDTFEAKRIGRLPQLFPLYPLTDLRTMNDRQPIYSIAFGQDALLAETTFFYLKDKDSALFA
jgi:CRISPR-associated endonuclease/helicase Cas3